jgi:hypothetical protein
MGQFQVTVVNPHSGEPPVALGAMAQTLQSCLTNLGHTCRIAENLFDASATNIFLGAHRLTAEQTVMIPPGSIIYNSEALSDTLPPSFYALARQHQVWDNDATNVEKWNALVCMDTPIHVPLESSQNAVQTLAKALHDCGDLIPPEPQKAVAAPGIQAQASPTHPHISQTAKTSNCPLIAYVEKAFYQALDGAGKIDPAVLAMDGMSGRKYRLLINNLIEAIPDARYLEIGTWAGSTLCSAINQNKVRATAIDNWSEFGGPKAQFLSNLERFRTPGADVTFIESDFRKIDYAGLGRFNVYMFDGPHTTADQYDGISLPLPALENEFVLIVDDWNHGPAREGTLKALAALNLNVLHAFAIRTTLDGSHPTLARQASDWHNGYFIAVVSKSPNHGIGG